MDRNVNIITDLDGTKIVLINDIVFRGKRSVKAKANIAICCQKCYSIYIRMCDNQMEAMKMGQSAISEHLDDPFYGEFNVKILKESIEQMEQHPERSVVKSLEELEELADG